jgi:hypothetical protein
LVFEDPDVDNSTRWIAPFLACGDLSGFDADATYELPAGHVSLDPVQPPTNPPYKAAQERKRAEGGAYGKTKYKEDGKAKTSACRVSERDLSWAVSVLGPYTQLTADLVPEVESGSTVAGAEAYEDAKSDLAVRSII